MPASVADPVSLVLRTSLSGKKGPFANGDSENSTELLEDRLAASAKRVLLTTIEYEPAPKQQVLSLDTLKAKYTVLTSTPSAKIASLNGLKALTPVESLPPPKVTLFRSEDVKVGWKGHVPVGSGMINMGNTCYMNSTLQALFHVPSLSNWLSSGKPCKGCDQGASQPCIVCVIAKTLMMTREKSGNGGVIKPFAIYGRLKAICKHLVHGRQEDAHEFMRYLVEAMEKAYLQSVGGTKLDSRSKETNPLGQIFGGYIRTEVTCLKCKNTSTTFQHFQDIPLDIQHASTVDDALGHYFRRERLEGDNAYKCEKCKSKVPATKKFSIERAPNVLCIQLKRFGLMGGKMSKHIQFARSLNLARFLFHQPAGGSMASNASLYKFVSLINHMGPSQHCGHYTAIAEASNGQLYMFDDSSVRPVSINSALSTGAYVLIFERVQSAHVLSNGTTKLNGINGVNGVHTAPPATLPPTPKPAGPKPGLISEPSRPKVIFDIKKNDTAGQQKPRLVIHNKGQPLFKSSVALGSQPSALGSMPAKTELPATASPPVSLAATPKPLTSKPATALVPYDSESSDDESDKEEGTPSVANGAISVVKDGVPIKATEATWQVSSSPTPAENAAPSSTATLACAIPTKWQVSDNSQQDKDSSSSLTSSTGSTGKSKWVVRSLSDTEAQRSHLAPSERVGSYSDTEADPSSEKGISQSSSLELASAKTPDTKRPVELDGRPGKVENCTESASTPTQPPYETLTANGKTVNEEALKESVNQSPSLESATSAPSTDKTANGTHSKWDGSRNNDTVKELLRMSHSGFSDQVRTWDGGKSHLTKLVEDDKRTQRKRTADELLDEEMDQGKVKKVKSKEENRETSPSHNGYNPFQQFQDRQREQQLQQQNQHHKANHFKKDQFRNHNRYGYQGSRGGRGSHRGGRGGSGPHHQYRPQAKNQPWRRFR